MQHVKQTVREKVKGWKMWQHLCVCALMVIKYHHTDEELAAAAVNAAILLDGTILWGLSLLELRAGRIDAEALGGRN